MQPIVSPMFIYILGIVEGVKLLFLTLGMTSITISVAGACVQLQEKGLIPRWCKTLFAIGLLSCTSVILIPSRETLIAMYTTKYITTENIKLGKEVVIDTIKEIVDEINRKKRD